MTCWLATAICLGAILLLAVALIYVGGRYGD